MKKILIPTNLTVLGDFAYGIAQKIAHQTGATIEALYVAVTHGNAVFDMNGKLSEHQDFDVSDLRTEMEEAEKRLKEWTTDKPDITKNIVTAGPLVQTITTQAEKDEVDLIIMGTEGSFGLKELTIGSVAEKVVRLSPVPVLTLKCDREDLSIQNILLVSDFASAEPINLDLVKSVQKAFHSRLHLLKINTKADFMSERAIQALMENFAENNQLENFEYHTYSDKSIEEGIRHYCEDHQIDFVAMTTHGRKGINRLLHHSIAEGVVNHVFLPVLTFKL